ncbi:hypothetical protein ALQ29_05592 [Pseudomonas marginalis pv. marginalis]|uniref:Uncharacterized protein n=1 Tax=Pseudomonas marginalis pv. marginalis TaxID=97473 RepID=A0A3M4AFE2_PSEMA|nr:hypothetical protein ALQ29_05592 [Pseudomonas marginalis pv. marginalis]
MGFQGQVVGIPITKGAAGHTRPIGKILQGVLPAQGTGGHREIRQALLQQRAGHIERHGGRDLATQGVGGHHHGFARSVDKRHIGQRVRPWLQQCAVGLVAVDKQVHRRWHRSLTGKLRQRIGHQVRAHRKVPRQLHAAQAHRTAPGQGAADHVTGLVGQQLLIIGETPGGVVAPVAVVQRTAADPIGQGLAVLTGIGQGAPVVEQAHFVPGGEVAAAFVGVVEIQVIVEQGAEAAHRLGTRIGVAVADELRLQPRRWHIQQQALAMAVVLAVQAGDLVQRHTPTRFTGQLHAHILQRTGRHVELPGPLIDRNNKAGVHLVDHQLQKQLCIGDSLHTARGRWQVASHAWKRNHCAAQPAYHRQPYTTSQTTTHHGVVSFNGHLHPFKTRGFPAPLPCGYRFGARFSNCGAPLILTCSGWSADNVSGTGQRMVAPGST